MQSLFSFPLHSGMYFFKNAFVTSSHVVRELDRREIIKPLFSFSGKRRTEEMHPNVFRSRLIGGDHRTKLQELVKISKRALIKIAIERLGLYHPGVLRVDNEMSFCGWELNPARLSTHIHREYQNLGRECLLVVVHPS